MREMGPSFVTVAAQGFYRSRVRNCYPLPHAASILCLRRVFSVIYKISSRPRATSSSSSAPSRKRKKRMANSNRSPESTLLR